MLKKITRILLLILLLSLSWSEEIVVSIPKGASLSSIASILKNQGLISNEFLFKLKAKIMKKENKFIYGKFKVDTESTMAELIEQLQDIKNLALIKVTIPEGYNLYKIDKLLSNLNLTSENIFYDYATNLTKFKHLLKNIPELYNEKEVTRLEGFLFPDTYLFEYDTNLEKIVATMVNNFEKQVLPIYRKAKKQGQLPQRLGKPLSFYNIINLASLVEWEAQVDKERPIIAGVYMNRMNKRMILGSCPTVLYARLLHGLPWKETLSYKDTKIDSLYNTYSHSGLPPSPINNPSIKSINAALNPATTPYYYFLSKGNGEHQFSRTEKEHNYFKRIYLK